MPDRPIYIDIDGTLTDLAGATGGNPIDERVARVQDLIANGLDVVLWSFGGTAYARAFAQANGLGGALCIGKPEYMVDDDPAIIPDATDRIITPEQFFAG